MCGKSYRKRKDTHTHTFTVGEVAHHPGKRIGEENHGDAERDSKTMVDKQMV